MKLSFVIPAYNEEKYIGGCLESILRELENKEHDVEIIVANNASADRTRKVAEGFPGVTVVDEPRKGMVRARHAGFAVSTGDLIANIDADTRLPKGWLEKVFKEFSQNDKLVAFSGPYIYYDINPVSRVAVRFFYFFGYLGHLLNHKILRKGAMLQGGNFVVRRWALEKIGGYDLDIEFYGEDTDIAKRIQKMGDVKFTFGLPMYTSSRRLKGEGLIKTGIKYAINHFWIIVSGKPLTKEYRDIR